VSEKGQSLVEFAISLTIILILLSGAVELGMGLFQYIQLRDAAQEGALFGSVCQDKAKIEKRARTSSSSPINLQDENVFVTIEKTNDKGIRVTLEYNHKVFMPFGSVFAGEYIHLKASVVDTILMEKTDCG